MYRPSVILRSCNALSFYNVYIGKNVQTEELRALDIGIRQTTTQDGDLADPPPHKVNAVTGREEKAQVDCPVRKATHSHSCGEVKVIPVLNREWVRAIYGIAFRCDLCRKV